MADVYSDYIDWRWSEAARIRENERRVLTDNTADYWRKRMVELETNQIVRLYATRGDIQEAEFKIIEAEVVSESADKTPPSELEPTG